jgi:hypothetical protein
MLQQQPQVAVTVGQQVVMVIVEEVAVVAHLAALAVEAEGIVAVGAGAVLDIKIISQLFPAIVIL